MIDEGAFLSHHLPHVLSTYETQSPSPFSAGAGRTGTYMAIDTMMYRLEEKEDINIFEYVELMRTRRTQMVQNAVSVER